MTDCSTFTCSNSVNNSAGRYRTISEDDTERLLEDRDRAGEWARRCQLEVNVEQYEGIHFAGKIRNEKYFIRGERMNGVDV